MNDEITAAEADGWVRDTALRFVERIGVFIVNGISGPPDRRAYRVLQQRYTRVSHGYGHDGLDERWIDVPLISGGSND